jgi:DNA-binding GntR family transcriptional regulator
VLAQWSRCVTDTIASNGRRVIHEEVLVFDQETIPDDSLSAQTYRSLRRGILTGRYAQGTALKENQIAAELEVSRIPVRSAIMQLANDGFLRTSPRRSARVDHWDERSIQELFDVRLSLEVLAARLAAHNVGAGADADRLRQALEDAHTAVAGRDRLAIAEAHALFHGRIVELADSTLIVSLMRTVLARMTWLFYLTGLDVDPAAQSHEHDELVDVIISGNERLAENLAFTHIEKGRVPTLSSVLGERGR